MAPKCLGTYLCAKKGEISGKKLTMELGGRERREGEAIGVAKGVVITGLLVEGSPLRKRRP